MVKLASRQNLVEADFFGFHQGGFLDVRRVADEFQTGSTFAQTCNPRCQFAFAALQVDQAFFGFRRELGCLREFERQAHLSACILSMRFDARAQHEILRDVKNHERSS